MRACRYSSQYQGKVRPTCNNGDGCDVCNEIWLRECRRDVANRTNRSMDPRTEEESCWINFQHGLGFQ